MARGGWPEVDVQFSVQLDNVSKGKIVNLSFDDLKTKTGQKWKAFKSIVYILDKARTIANNMKKANQLVEKPIF